MITALYYFGAFVVISCMFMTWCLCRIAAISDARMEKLRGERR